MVEVDDVKRAAEILSSKGDVLVLTGAGISTESGIPDFRSPGGVWDRYDPEEFTYQNFVSNPEHRRTYWQMSLEIYPVLAAAKPNPAHQAVVELERRGLIRAVVTQNIDGLHQDAGSSHAKVIEIHGTTRAAVCLSCGDRRPRDEIQARVQSGDLDPACNACGGILKPATVSFGQAMPEEETALAFGHAERCGAMLVIGSSLVVYPVAWLPKRAVESGASLVIVNRDPTPYDDVADVVLQGSAAATMSSLVAALR